MRSRFAFLGIVLKLMIGKLERCYSSERAYLSRDVLRKLVLELRTKYRSYRMAAKALGLPDSFFSLWLHGKQRSVRVRVLLKILRVLSREDVLVKKIEPLNEYRRRSIAKANEKKKQPNVRFSSIVMRDSRGTYVDVLRWLDEIRYIERLQSMRGVARLIDMDVNKEILTLRYHVFVRADSKFVTRTSVLPRFLTLNEDMMYFLGLWTGDGAGGGRVGVVNKNPSLLAKSVDLLRKCFRQPQDLIIGNVMSTRRLRGVNRHRQENLLRGIGVSRISYTINKKCYGSLVFSVSIHNNLLRRLLDFLRENLHKVLSSVNAEDRGAFYAGLFDAEGNVNFNLNKRELNFRWATGDPRFAESLMRWLQQDGFYLTHYDGANVKVGCRMETRRIEFQRFEKLIFPQIVHPEKRSVARKLLNYSRG